MKLVDQNKIIIIIVSLVAGFLIMQQVKVRLKVAELTSTKNTSPIATEVAELIKSNKKSREELNTIEAQKKSIEAAVSSKTASEEAISKEINDLKIVTGEVAVKGEGVQIDIDKSIQVTQLIDLLNALRNIGVEGMSINDKRILFNTPITSEIIITPLTVRAIGNSEVLNDSLLRRGGIIEQISGSNKVTISDNINLPAVK